MCIKKKTRDELGEELCNYCELKKESKGGQPVMYPHFQVMCDNAYKTYLESEEKE